MKPHQVLDIVRDRLFAILKIWAALRGADPNLQTLLIARYGILDGTELRYGPWIDAKALEAVNGLNAAFIDLICFRNSHRRRIRNLLRYC
jgi:hypothetical protein